MEMMRRAAATSSASGGWGLQGMLRQVAGAGCGAAAAGAAWGRAGAGRDERRAFGRKPNHDVPPLKNHRDWPRVKDITAAYKKPMRRKEWMGQPMPLTKDMSREERKAAREEFLFKRSLPPPLPTAVLHGSRTRLEQDNTFRRWWHVDCEGKVMGRVAQEVARVILGKHKPIYDPAQIMGDYVVITNVEKMAITGKKLDQNFRRWHTGRPGGLQEVPYREMMKYKPDTLLRMIISFALPRNGLRRERLKLARIFKGPDHPHTAEDIQPLPNFLKVPSPWVPQRITEEDEVLGPNGELAHVFADETMKQRISDLTDNHGKVWDVEEVMRMIELGAGFSDKVMEDHEKILKAIPGYYPDGYTPDSNKKDTK